MGRLALKHSVMYTGAIETKPLAPGRYWIDLFGSKEYRKCLYDCFQTAKSLSKLSPINLPGYYYACKAKCYLSPAGANEGVDAFNAWGNANHTAVRVLNQENYDEQLVEDAFNDTFTPPRTWLLFETIAPVEWPSSLTEVIGLPTPAASNVMTSDDTVQKPPPEPGPFEKGGTLDFEEGSLSWVPWVAGGAVVVAGLFAVARIVRG